VTNSIELRKRYLNQASNCFLTDKLDSSEIIMAKDIDMLNALLNYDCVRSKNTRMEYIDQHRVSQPGEF